MSNGDIYKESKLSSPHTDYETIIECAYNAILLRPSDDAGRAYWINQLTGNHADFKDFLSFLFSSKEFSTRLRPFLDTYLGANMPLHNDHSQNGEVSILLTNMINIYARHRIVVDAGLTARW